MGARLGYVAGISAFAAGYLIVLLLSPLVACGFGAWAGRVSANPVLRARNYQGSGPRVPASPAMSSPSSR